MKNIVKNDPWLKPYEAIITGRHKRVEDKIAELTDGGRISLSDFATGYLYFGLHRTANGWVIRDWAPNATAIYLVGDFNQWQRRPEYALHRIENGIWELHLSADQLAHGDLFKFVVCWNGGEGERIPAWANRVVQDEKTNIFTAQVWQPAQPYKFKKRKFKPSTSPLLIYECHIGMSTEREGYGTYNEFRELVLPRIKALGYNAIQIMAIQEHPYYGSFGYHVSSFFAASSKFGTPDELKELIDTAHQMGIAVIMDIVHSHAVKNEAEGLALFDGGYDQYFYSGEKRNHPVWDSLCFNYGRNEVLHFLLSNCKYWLEEYKFDGFRFDGATSMLYHSHGLGEAFVSYDDYYNGNQDDNAIVYLTLANLVIHETNPNAITIAEEMSGMPGLASPFADGGYGFDYRMAMNIPDYWIKIIKEKKDEDWHPTGIFWELTNRRSEEKTISYAESHDQALVGDKTIIFRLIDADMYWHMSRLQSSTYQVDRGLALHKMIRLATLATINGGYLNFMGNEFGHPEWIDFPREGNNWSYKYARRQWSLVDNSDLKYQYLARFDRDMLEVVKSQRNFSGTSVVKLWEKDGDNILAFARGKLLFVFNFHPSQSFSNYGILAPLGTYTVLLDSDDKQYGGFALQDHTVEHSTVADKAFSREKKGWLKLYLPARTALVLHRK